jgi:hypothetical protein
MVEVAGVETRFYGYVNIWKLSNCITPSDSKLFGVLQALAGVGAKRHECWQESDRNFQGILVEQIPRTRGYSEGGVVQYW